MVLGERQDAKSRSRSFADDFRLALGLCSQPPPRALFHALVHSLEAVLVDSSAVIKKVLEVCWVGLWSDPKVKRTLKVNIFNENTLTQLLRIYERAAPEGGDAQDVPADIVHHFLLAICTRPGVGVCFKDRGWYPRDADSEDQPARDEEAEGTAHGRGRIYNKILANLLRNLKVNDDPRHQELAMKIFGACPELVAG